MNVSIIGLGYVGGTTAACFAELGHNVIGIDSDAKKIEIYNSGKAPFYEKGLDRLIRDNLAEGRLHLTNNIASGIKDSEVIILALGTPPKPDGYPDLSAMETVASEIGKSLDHYAVIVEKSTVPIRTAEWMDKILGKNLPRNKYDLAACPEFLSEATAVDNFMNPDRIVIGAETDKADQLLIKLYKPIEASTLHTSVKAAEIIKHASNAFLYMKIAFAYSLSQFCDAEGDVNAEEVLKGVGMDRRIGSLFLTIGPGVGGMCFPKDLDAFIAMYKQFEVYPGLFDAVKEINKLQKQHFVNKVMHAFDNNLTGKTLGILGLAFKAGTDDMRMAASIDIIHKLQEQGAKIVAYDPKAINEAKKILKDIEYANNVNEVADKSDALLVLTEWQEFKDLDMKSLREKVDIVIDGRNLYKTKRMLELGYKYDSIGRPLKFKQVV